LRDLRAENGAGLPRLFHREWRDCQTTLWACPDFGLGRLGRRGIRLVGRLWRIGTCSCPWLSAWLIAACPAATSCRAKVRKHGFRPVAEFGALDAQPGAAVGW